MREPKQLPGTEITLYLNEDSYEFANEYKAKEVLDKYCSFMPVPIFVTNEDAGEQTEEIPEEEVTEKDTVLDTFIKDAVTEEVEKEDGTKETVEKVPAKKMAKIVKDQLQSTISIHSGQSILMNVQMKITRNSTARYSTIIKNHYSGFTLTWIIHSILRVFSTSLRLIQSMNLLKVL